MTTTLSNIETTIEILAARVAPVSLADAASIIDQLPYNADQGAIVMGTAAARDLYKSMRYIELSVVESWFNRIQAAGGLVLPGLVGDYRAVCFIVAKALALAADLSAKYEYECAEWEKDQEAA